MKNISYISVELPNKDRPAERPPKTNWKIELITVIMKGLQHLSPRMVARVVWHFFTLPGKAYFNSQQDKLLEQAVRSETIYQGDKIVSYRWKGAGPRVLFCHGWRSKAADFRKMIQAFLNEGYEVEAIDCRAHGHSEGSHSALPEFRDIIKDHIEQNGPADIMIGYSMGGASLGIALSELPKTCHPSQLFLLAAPPFVRFFFEDVINQVGLKKKVLDKMIVMMENHYGQHLDYFDLRTKPELNSITKHLIYCEDDETVPFKKGLELFETMENGSLVQARGFGHYKIISQAEIIRYILEKSTEGQRITA